MTDLNSTLDEASEKIGIFLDEILPMGKPEELYKATRHLVEAGGKRLRPFVTLEACKLVGGDPEKAVPMAAAMELVHSFTLVHDDIMDQDHQRRGVPTVHTLYGIPLAINAGDMLFAKSLESALRASLRNVPSRRVLQAMGVIAEAVVTVCEGQAMDMALEKRDLVDEFEYLEMIERKTAALLVAASKVGVVMGGGSNREMVRLARAMRDMGLAFQIVDDILGLTADEKALGKPVGSDIREGKKTIIVFHGLKHGRKRQRDAVLRALGKRDATTEQLGDAISSLRSAGSVDYAARKAELFTRRAKKELRFFPPSEARDLLVSLVDYVVARDR